MNLFSERSWLAVLIFIGSGCSAMPGSRGLAYEATTGGGPTPEVTELIWAEVSEGEISASTLDTRAFVPLFTGERDNLSPRCSGAFVGPGLVLTATHCFNADYFGTIWLGLQGNGFGDRWELLGDAAHLACVWAGGNSFGDKCVEFARYSRPPYDVATIFAEQASGAVAVHTGRLTEKRYPQMYMVGYRGLLAEPKIRAVCNAHSYTGTPTYTGYQGRPFPGDSGGALVAIVGDTRRIVLLGVMHGGQTGTQNWLFSPVPDEIPRPRGTGVPTPEVVEIFEPEAFASIPECEQGR